jgi:hypothetical protein
MVKGPWDDLPAQKPPPREPLLKRGSRLREPFVNNWRMLAILLLMLFVMPPVVRWLYYMLVGMFMGGG